MRYKRGELKLISFETNNGNPAFKVDEAVHIVRATYVMRFLVKFQHTFSALYSVAGIELQGTTSRFPV